MEDQRSAWQRRSALKARLGNLFAKCPYCQTTDFLPAGDGDKELVCAQCGGYASRRVILERLAEEAAELGELTLARLKKERLQNGKKSGPDRGAANKNRRDMARRPATP